MGEEGEGRRGEKSKKRKERGVDRKKEQKWKTKRVSPVLLTSLNTLHMEIIYTSPFIKQKLKLSV